MKSSFLRRHRGWLLAAFLVPALTFNPINPLLRLAAQTGSAPAPSGLAASAEVDKETGKPVVTTASGLKYVDLAPGSGEMIKTGDEVTVNYVGKLIDGTVFDASAKHPPGTFTYTQGVTSLIAGWTEGTSTMKPGGKRKLIIPPNLGYGADGTGDVIPPNATLIFEIDVISVKPAGQ